MQQGAERRERSNPQTELGSQVSSAEQSASGAELKVLSTEQSVSSTGAERVSVRSNP
jgi:hypothetical protein